MQGAAVHIIRMDEEPNRDIYEENMARQITTGLNLILTMTPLNYSYWVYGEIYERASTDPNIETFHGSSEENRFADPTVLAAMLADLDDVSAAARLHGQFTYLSGRVWPEYGDHNLVDCVPIPREWHRSIIIDPHPEKPTAVNWVAEDHQGHLFVYREADIKGDVQHISDRIKTESAGEYIDTILIDPSSRQSATIRGKGSLIDEFRAHFPNVIEANNNRELGWDVVKKMSKDRASGPQLYVMRNCPVTDHQMRNYSWKPPTPTGESRNKPEVVKRNDDHCDCIRYRCMAKFINSGASFDGFQIGVYANSGH